MSAAVALEGATLALGGRVVLRGLDLSIAPGEFIGVLGPNGAGKTTLLRALLGLVRPVAGRVLVDGVPAAPGAHVGYVPQQRPNAAGLRLSGLDLVQAAAGPCFGPPWASRRERAAAAWALAQVEAGALARRPLATLSGGERQRVLMAQALLGRPRLLLLDEPLMSLDPRHQRQVVELVARLRDRLGLTVLFTAHELNPLLGAIDRVMFLGNGNAALGPVDQVATGPALSALYGTPIEVLRSRGRIVVLPGADWRDHACHEGEHAPMREVG